MLNEEILGVIEHQLQNFWNIRFINRELMLEQVSKALLKVNRSFGASNDKYYLRSGFSIFNSSQYSVFLYYLSNIVGKEVSCNLCLVKESGNIVLSNTDGGG